MTLAGANPKLEVVAKSVDEQLEDTVAQMKCYNCGAETDRFIRFMTAVGIVHEFECIDCRQERVKEQVEAGLRPASDLLPENLPEVRNPL